MMEKMIEFLNFRKVAMLLLIGAILFIGSGQSLMAEEGPVTIDIRENLEVKCCIVTVHHGQNTMEFRIPCYKYKMVFDLSTLKFKKVVKTVIICTVQVVVTGTTFEVSYGSGENCQQHQEDVTDDPTNYQYRRVYPLCCSPECIPPKEPVVKIPIVAYGDGITKERFLSGISFISTNCPVFPSKDCEGQWKQFVEDNAKSGDRGYVSYHEALCQCSGSNG